MKRTKENQIRLHSVLTNIWGYLALKVTLLAALCLWAFGVQLKYRIPSRFLVFLLPVVGVALSAVGLLFLVNNVVKGVSDQHPLPMILLGLERWASLLIVLFIGYSVFLYTNGKLDRSAPIEISSEILSVSGAELEVGSRIPYSWTTLRSWESPGETERLLLQSEERRTLWGGEAVTVQVRRGYFGIPWVARLKPDEEKYDLEILKIAPSASGVWKHLVNSYFTQQRWKEGAQAAQEYFQIYPNDDPFMLEVGAALEAGGAHDEAVVLLNRVIARRPRLYEAYQLLGEALNQQGNRERAAEVLETSVQLNPDDWEAYYHLGYVYRDLGRLKEAAGMFERVMERHPHFPQVEDELAGLWKSLALTRSSAERPGVLDDPSQSVVRSP